MIYYLSKQEVIGYTIATFLGSWAGEIARHIRLISYENAFRMRTLRVGTYIFSDIDRLSPKETEKAAHLWNTLSNSGEGVRLLNHPVRSLRRYELLRRLHEQRVNDFNVYRLTEKWRPERFPVFIRGENDHDGPITPVLRTQAELDQAIERLVIEGRSRDNKVIVEYCDAADSHGVHHKYGAYIVGEEIVPRSLMFGQDWVLKGASIEFLGEPYIEKERRYLEDNPHASIIRPIFEMAEIQYGRMDYAVVDGQVRVFEINTNPAPYGRRARDPARLRTSDAFARRFEAALQAIDCADPPAKSIRLAMPRDPDHRPRYPLVRGAINGALRLFDLLEYEESLLAILRKAWSRIVGNGPGP